MSTSVFDQAWQRERPVRAFEDLFDPFVQAAAGRAGHPSRLALSGGRCHVSAAS
jgi:hypothetical protein